MIESCHTHTFDWVTCHKWRGATNKLASIASHMCEMTPSCVWHASFICVTWLLHMCDMTHSYVWHDSCVRVTCLIHKCVMSHWYVWYDSFICVTWLLHMTHSYVWHDSFMCVTWLIHTCDMTPYTYDMTHSCVWHDSFTCVTWLIRMCDMTHSYVWHDSFICLWLWYWPTFQWGHEHMNETCHTYEWIMSHMWRSHVTYMNDLYHIRMFETHICVMYTTRKCRRV